jgi:uncharacterized Zn finger protein
VTPFANILHHETIRRLSTDRSFERGQAYFEEGRIRGLIFHKGSIRASVKGASDYAVRIWVHDESLAYSCSCPQGQDKAFCKHAVALGLAWLAKGSRPSPRPLRRAGDPVRRALEDLDRDALVELLCELAADDDRVRRRILGA